LQLSAALSAPHAAIVMERGFSVQELEAPVPGEGPLGEILAHQHLLENQLQRQLLMLQSAAEERNCHRMILLQIQAGLDELRGKVTHGRIGLCPDSHCQSEGEWNTISSNQVDRPMHQNVGELTCSTSCAEGCTQKDINIQPPPCESSNDSKPEKEQLATEDRHSQPVKSETNCAALSKLRAIVSSNLFEMSFAVLICLNSVTMAAELQNVGLELGWRLGVEDVRKPPDAARVFLILDQFFMVALFLEVTVKVLAFRVGYFRSCLNVVDFVCVLLGAIDLFNLADLGFDPTIIRLIRLSKITRVLHLLKTASWLDVLRFILKSVRGSVSTVVWSMLLLFLVQSIAGLLVGQVLMEHMNNDKVPPAERRAVYVHWGTYWRVVCTMFEITFVNANTPGIRVLMDNIDLAWSSFFMLYRVGINFVLLSVVKAVIVKQTFKVAESNAEILIQQTLRANSKQRSKLKEVFDLMDTSHDGKVSKDEMSCFLDNPDVQMVFNTLDVRLSCSDANRLFDLLDLDGSGYVEFDEVMEGFAKIQGAAKGIDMHEALIRIDDIRQELSGLKCQLQRPSP